MNMRDRVSKVDYVQTFCAPGMRRAFKKRADMMSDWFGTANASKPLQLLGEDMAVTACTWEACKHSLEQQGWQASAADLDATLQDLCAWLRRHARKPLAKSPVQDLNETELEENKQWRRCSAVRKLARQGRLSPEQLDMLKPFWAYISVQHVQKERNEWLEELCAWLRHHKRKPRCLESCIGNNETELEENKQWRRCSAVRKLARQGRLSPEQLDMLKPFWAYISVQHVQKERNEWLEELCAWLRHHKRKPRCLESCIGNNETELEENKQWRRCSAVRKLARQGRLSPEQLDMLKPFWAYISVQDVQNERNEWLEELCAWLRHHKRKPRCLESCIGNNETELEERRQTRRCKAVRALARQGSLSQEQLAMLEPFWAYISVQDVHKERGEWLEKLCAWLRHHKRKPRRPRSCIGLNETEREESKQERRCQAVRRWAQRGRLSQEQLEMLEPFWVYISATGVEERRAVCLEELCAWLRHHKRKPRYFALCAGLNESELEERKQNQACSNVRDLSGRGLLSHEQLSKLKPFWTYISACGVREQQNARVEELCAWLRQHKRKPRRVEYRIGLNETELEERRQERRYQTVRRLARQGSLSQQQLDVLKPFWAYISADHVQQQRNEWLEELCAWLRHHKRKPRCLESCIGNNETELEERRQTRRCKAVRALARQGSLSQEQLAMLEPFWAYISVQDVQKERNEWLEELCAWLRHHKRKPRCLESCIGNNETELEERRQRRRCQTVRRLARQGSLSQQQLALLEPFWAYISVPDVHKERSEWLEELCAWLRHHKRKPRCLGNNETEREESKQERRCQTVRRLARQRSLSQEHLAMLEPFWAYIPVQDVHKEGSKWLKELCAWLLQHKRKPRYFDSERRSALNETQQEERRQA